MTVLTYRAIKLSMLTIRVTYVPGPFDPNSVINYLSRRVTISFEITVPNSKYNTRRNSIFNLDLLPRRP